MTNEEAIEIIDKGLDIGNQMPFLTVDQMNEAQQKAFKALRQGSGFWIYDSYYGGIYKCSICGHWQGMKSDFCPECGASMKAG